MFIEVSLDFDGWDDLAMFGFCVTCSIGHGNEQLVLMNLFYFDFNRDFSIM